MKLTRWNELVEDGEKVKGRWEITPNYEVRYRREGKDEEIGVRGSLVAAEPDALLISVTEKQADQKIVTSLVKLSGAWRLDDANRVVFEVERERGRNDMLTLQGAWRVGDSHELVVTCARTDLKTKKKEVREIVFNGFWDISERNRLTYSLGADSNSAFRFRGTFQTKSILAKAGEIRYQAGVEILGRRKFQTLALFGKWKVSDTLGLSFEIEYGDGRTKAITFGGEYAPGDDRQVVVNLKNREGEPLGIEVIFTKDLFGKDGQAFLRLQRSAEESRVEAGTKFRW